MRNLYFLLIISCLAFCHLTNAAAIDKPSHALRRIKRQGEGTSEDVAPLVVANVSMIAQDFGKLHQDTASTIESNPKRDSQTKSIPDKNNSLSKDKKDANKPARKQAHGSTKVVAASSPTAAVGAVKAAHVVASQSKIHTPTGANLLQAKAQTPAAPKHDASTAVVKGAVTGASGHSAPFSYGLTVGANAGLSPLFEDGMVGMRENDDFATLDTSAVAAGATVAKDSGKPQLIQHGDDGNWPRYGSANARNLVECNAPARRNLKRPPMSGGNNNQLNANVANNEFQKQWHNINLLPQKQEPMQLRRTSLAAGSGDGTTSDKFSPIENFMHFANLIMSKMGIEQPQFHAAGAQLLMKPNFGGNYDPSAVLSVSTNNKGNNKNFGFGEMLDLDGLDYLFDNIDGLPTALHAGDGADIRPFVLQGPTPYRPRLEEADLLEPFNLQESALGMLMDESEGGGGAEQEVELRCPVHRNENELRASAAGGGKDDMIQVCTCRLIKKKAKK